MPGLPGAAAFQPAELSFRHSPPHQPDSSPLLCSRRCTRAPQGWADHTVLRSPPDHLWEHLPVIATAEQAIPNVRAQKRSTSMV